MKSIVLCLVLCLVSASASAQEVQVSVEEPSAATGLTMVPLPGNVIGFRFQNEANTASIQGIVTSPGTTTPEARALELRNEILNGRPSAATQVTADSYKASFAWAKGMTKKILGRASIKLLTVDKKSYLIEFWGVWPQDQDGKFAPVFSWIVRSTKIL
jgi:hypothetical protein